MWITRRVGRVLAVAGLLLLGLVALVVIASFFVDEPLRRYAEDQLNAKVPDYQFHIGKLILHPLSLSLDLQDLTMAQRAHPEPPLAHVDRWQATVQWRALLHGSIVSHHLFEKPVLHLTRPQAGAEAKDKQEVEKKGWQEAVLAVYPITINHLEIRDGELTYVDADPHQPIRLERIQLVAEDIRNVRSEAGQYPSDLKLEAHLVDQGDVRVQGKADFLAEPHVALNVDIEAHRVDLGRFLPLLSRYHVQLRQGFLTATGHVEYAPSVQVVDLREVTVEDLRVDYVHAAAAAKPEAHVAKKTADKAAEAHNEPGIFLKIDHGRIDRSEVGFVNDAVQPPYRVFLADTHAELQNVSNQLREGTARITLTGRFMGTGATQVRGAFRPEHPAPDFDLHIRVEGTQLKTLNPLLRAYGKFDVTKGRFSVFSEINVKDRAIQGYVKPLLNNLQVYEPHQDKEKGFLQKLWEAIVGGASEVLENEPRQEVATKVDLAGKVEAPRTHTWEAVVRLIQNAFFEAILPGFEGPGGHKAAQTEKRPAA